MSSPFNEEKYKALLEGLEIAIVKFSELSKVIDYRIEAEYFAHKFLEIDKAISKIKTISFTEVATFINGRPYGSDCFNCNEGVRISKIGDVTNKREISEWEYVTLDEFRAQKGRFLIDGDILMTLTGDPPDVGKVNYIYNPDNASWNQRVAKIRIKPKQTFYKNNDVLFAVLSSEFSRTQLERYAKGIRQRNLGNESLERLRIPILSNDIQNLIEDFIKSSFQSLSKSRSLYSEAEDILLSELGLKDWQPNNNPFNIKQLKESFLASGRLDAEYYQSKYDEIETVITKYKHGYDKIGKLFAQNTDVCDYKEDAYNYIEIGDINISDGTATFNLVSKEELPDNAKRVLHKNDLLISKVRPYRGAVAIIDFDDERLIGSGAFTALRENSTYKKEVLQILLRTQIYKDWLLKWNVGSSYPVIKDEDILNLPIPIIPNIVQSEIAGYVQRSMSLRGEAKQLLENAKLKVESEIINGGGI